MPFWRCRSLHATLCWHSIISKRAWIFNTATGTSGLAYLYFLYIKQTKWTHYMEVFICKFLHLYTTNLVYLVFIHDPTCTSDIVFHIIAIEVYWMGINGTVSIDTPTCLDILTSIKKMITDILVKTVKAYSMYYVSNMSCIKIKLYSCIWIDIMYLVYKKCFCRCVVVEFQLIYCVLNETALVKIVS